MQEAAPCSILPQLLPSVWLVDYACKEPEQREDLQLLHETDSFWESDLLLCRADQDVLSQVAAIFAEADPLPVLPPRVCLGSGKSLPATADSQLSVS